MKRGDIYWADLGPPAGRRPVVILTRDSAITVLEYLTVVPVTRTIRGIASELSLGEEEGLPEPCVAVCDNVATISKVSFGQTAIGTVGAPKTYALDQALRFALDIRY